MCAVLCTACKLTAFLNSVHGEKMLCCPGGGGGMGGAASDMMCLLIQPPERSGLSVGECRR